LDGRGDLPIDLALQGFAEGIANTLVGHKADVNRPDPQGLSLLHKAIKRGPLLRPNVAICAINSYVCN